MGQCLGDIMTFGVSCKGYYANLLNLLNVTQKEGLVLKSKKLELQREMKSYSLAQCTSMMACIQTLRSYKGFLRLWLQ